MRRSLCVGGEEGAPDPLAVGEGRNDTDTASGFRGDVPRRGRCPRGLLVAVGIAMLTAVIFLPTVGYGFLPFDDYANVGTNPWFRGDRSAGLSWIFRSRTLGHWIPVTWASYALDYALWGRNPGGYHATNVAVHAVNAALFYFAARRILRLAMPVVSPAAVALGGVVAALAFGIHPLRVESVAWVTERRDVLSGLFFLLTVLAYLRAAEREGAAARTWFAASVAAFTGSILSKEITMTGPLVLLLLDVYPLRRIRWPASIVEKIPFVAVSAICALVSLRSVAADAGFTSLDRLGIGARLSLFAYSAVFYPLHTLLPFGLSPLHEAPYHVDPWAPPFVASAAVVAAVTAVSLLTRRRAPWLGAAWAYSVLTVMPVSGLVHSGTILVADRYSYLTTLSWAIVIGGGASALVTSPLRRVLRVVSIASIFVVLGGWIALTVADTRDWRDDEALWTAAVAADPSCAACHAGLGLAYLNRNRVREAEAEIAAAVALRPDRAEHHAMLGAVLEREARADEAARAWANAARLESRYAADARRAGGLALLARGQYESAVRELRAAEALRPMVPVRSDLARALGGLAAERIRAGQLEAAAQALEDAVALGPDSSALRERLTAVQDAMRQRRQAIPRP